MNVRKDIYIVIKDADGCNLSAHVSLEHFRYFLVFEFLKVNTDPRALREAFGFQLQLDSCKHEVMVAADVGTLERPCFLLC